MNFFKKVLRETLRIPKGKVATYGQIASLLYSPRSSRAVGLALRSLPAENLVPWHRVVNAKGMISIENLSVPKIEQVKRLQRERIKVEFKNGNYWVDLKNYQWIPQS